MSVADPGFPVGGGVDLVGGGVDSRGSYISKIFFYVKTKELGPLGGGRARRAPPPRSANACTKRSAEHGPDTLQYCLSEYVPHFLETYMDKLGQE